MIEAASVAFLLAVVAGWYAATSILLLAVFGRTVLPLGKLT